jgi:hypothetical protein
MVYQYEHANIFSEGANIFSERGVFILFLSLKTAILTPFYSILSVFSSPKHHIFYFYDYLMEKRSLS